MRGVAREARVLSPNWYPRFRAQKKGGAPSSSVAGGDTSYRCSPGT